MPGTRHLEPAEQRQRSRADAHNHRRAVGGGDDHGRAAESTGTGTGATGEGGAGAEPGGGVDERRRGPHRPHVGGQPRQPAGEDHEREARSDAELRGRV